jgi:peptide/nickel transport system permease protein
MRRAVRRLTWILLSLGLMTVLCFGLLAELLPRAADTRALPRFFNPAPRNVRDLSLAAIERLERGADPAAAAELARLGGAALPFVLTNFERRDEPARERLALALAPVAVRMGAARSDELESAERAVRFWERFWQDRSVDFRDTVVRRLVSRLGERSLALRREDVLTLDTYALPALIQALGRVQGKDDVMRVRRLTTVLAHVGGQPLTIERTASVDEARRVVRQWQGWWEENGADFSSLDGPHRLAAMVKETAYGRWLSSVLRGELGRARDGRSGLDLLRSASGATALRFGLVLGLGTLLGALGAWQAYQRSGALLRVARAALLSLVALPIVALLAALGPASRGATTVLALTLLVAWQAAHVFVLSRHSDDEPVGFASQLIAALSLLAPAAPLVFSLVTALECVLGLGGLGLELRAALLGRDLHAAMAVALGGALLSALSLLLGDALQAALGVKAEVGPP